MTKLTSFVRATIRDVVEKQLAEGSPAVMRISARVVREHLRDEHGINVRLSTIRRVAERPGQFA